MRLDEVPTGLTVTVESCTGTSAAIRRRLAELGVRSGTVLHLNSRTSGGGAILAIGDDRIAVSRQVLRTVEVSEESAHV